MEGPFRTYGRCIASLQVCAKLCRLSSCRILSLQRKASRNELQADESVLRKYERTGASSQVHAYEYLNLALYKLS
jgi:hypothetical protein